MTVRCLENPPDHTAGEDGENVRSMPIALIVPRRTKETLAEGRHRKSGLREKALRASLDEEQINGPNRSKSKGRAPGRACLGAQARNGGTLGAHHWIETSTGQDRDDEPRLQHDTSGTTANA